MQDHGIVAMLESIEEKDKYIKYLEDKLHRVKSESPHEDYGCGDAQPMNASSALFSAYGG